MSLLNISEPGQTTKPHESKLVIGIDLGTTNSLVAATRSGMTETLDDAHGRAMLPSVVAINQAGKRLVGYEALATDAQFDKIHSAKRIIGYSCAEIAAEGLAQTFAIVDTATIPAIKTIGGELTPIDVSAEILSALKARAETAFARTVEGAVITVPAYFDETRRKATKDAATLAGLNVLRLINEPTAAALAYGLDKSARGNVLVYDLGGGTFDVSVLSLTEGIFEVKATLGDILLGGDDFDRAIVDWLIQTDATTLPYSVLKAKAKAAKEKLAETNQVDITLAQQTVTLTRQQFDALIEPWIQQTLQQTQQAIRDAGLTIEAIDHVVCVGGSTRIKLVQEKLKALFDLDVLTDVDPDKVVAIGAGIAAENLSGNRKNDSLLLDVTPLSLGIETAGELVEVIVPRNTPIPITRAQDFTTYKNGQTAMRIHVVQGERDQVSECRSLANFQLTGIPPMAAGAARIRITFSMDADGLLTVSATEQTTGAESVINVTPSYGLTDDAITDMLLASMNHAESDSHFRRLNEQKVEAERVLEAIREALKSDGDLLSPVEAEPIVLSIGALEKAMTGQDASAIKHAINAVEKAADSFIERRMNHAISKVMKGHDVDEFSS